MNSALAVYQPQFVRTGSIRLSQKVRSSLVREPSGGVILETEDFLAEGVGLAGQALEGVITNGGQFLMRSHQRLSKDSLT